jgi:hypothetical protein
MLDVLDLVALGGLPSFEQRFSEVVILPEATPDGTKFGGAADLAALTEALGALAPSRKEGLSRLGISTDLMKEMGVGGSDVLSIVAGARTSEGKPAFEARIGGVNASWISNGGGTTSPPVVSNHPQADGSVRTYVTWDNKTAQITTTKRGDGITQSVVESVTEIQPDGSRQDVTREKEDEALKLKEAADKKSSPAPSQPASPAPSPPASPAPSSSDEDELAPLAPKPKPSGGYADPNEVETRVVITRTDIERVVRIVRGSNSTPAQVDVEGPEIDPSEVQHPLEPYAYRDPTHETGTFVTVPPVRPGEANTNFGPGGPLGPR